MDPRGYDLGRFLVAQEGAYDAAVRELQAGRKTGHWIWFIFPQLRGLGRSELSHYYGLVDGGEALAYLRHGVLGPRLLACTGLLLAIEGRTAEEILGHVDALKVRSCMTVFHRVAPDEPLFRQVLERYYGGDADPVTDELLGRPADD